MKAIITLSGVDTVDTFSTERRELMRRLLRLQGKEENRCIDIVTISGFMTTEELIRHVEKYEKK